MTEIKKERQNERNKESTKDRKTEQTKKRTKQNEHKRKIEPIITNHTQLRIYYKTSLGLS